SIVDIELHVVGEGKELSNLIRLTKELGLTDSVKFLGFLSAEELVRQYHHATLFALASRQEGLGIVFIEAMSTGLPVVATDCGGSADPILDGVTGILSPVGDDHSLAQNIILLLQDSTMRRRMCDAARSRAVEEYSSEKIFTKLDKIYEHVFGI
ncbi:MAG: glycosyltransferase family 4 protein, partial [Gammaproteobacteria bacterium]|nr:glycosyltransferase family 4 protein [Gammaproteobacteria bacterium]